MPFLTQTLERFNLEKQAQYFGSDIAKIPANMITKNKFAKDSAKLVLVTAITPTPLGEGKTTVSIGLTDGLNLLGKKATVALREPSLGPVFGRKGGATGGGMARIIPEEKINLHFTGDFPAITAVHNLIASMIEHQLFFNLSNIDPQTIMWKRAIDMNDRHLREITIEIDDETQYQSGFQITAASEVMAIFCLAEHVTDLVNRLENIIVAYTYEGNPYYVKDLMIRDALFALLAEAFNPNVVTTKEGNLAFVHGGPFANIAHGCCSRISLNCALNYSEFVVTEAGFGSDLGAEKFFNILVPQLQQRPHVIVLVATLRGLKYHGGVALTAATRENNVALKRGYANLKKHIENLKNYKIPIIVTLNQFVEDTAEEIQMLADFVHEQGVKFVVNQAFLLGGEGTLALGETILTIAAEEPQKLFSHPYNNSMDVYEKIRQLVKTYGANGLEFSKVAKEKIINLTEKQQQYPICIAKTPEAFTQEAKDRGIPKSYVAHVRDIRVANGAKMLIVYMGTIIDMPGLPRDPQAQHFARKKEV